MGGETVVVRTEPLEAFIVVDDSAPNAGDSAKEDPLRGIWEGSSVRVFKAEQALFRTGSPQTHMYKVASGAVRLYKTLGDGRRQVLGFAFAGDLVGIELRQRHPFGAQAIVATRAHCTPAAAMRTLALDNPRLMFELHQTLADQLAAAQDLALSIGRRSADERLCRFLVALSQRHERKGSGPAAIDLSMPRSDIADHLGFTMETISRTLRRLENQRLIKLAKPRVVQILDMSGLRQLMDGRERAER